MNISKLRFKISMSLDGFVAGPDQSVNNPLGVGGMRLHQWAFPLKAWRSMIGLEGGEVNLRHGRHRVRARTGAASRGRQGRVARRWSECRAAVSRAGLVDEMEIHLVPTLLGSGERLFDGVGDDLHGLELVRTVAAPKVTHLKFARQ